LSVKKHDLKYLLRRLRANWDHKTDPVTIRDKEVYLTFSEDEEYLLTAYGDDDYKSRMEAVLELIFELEQEQNDEAQERSFFNNLKRYFSTTS
jgi:hypothetical protein